ncbi:Pirin domain protein [Paenibacillus curdlanolyticus YK9]|uniref:Pirin domain protein n=1 Tax=Paenibacillus curdlanolyticus YK9 TaxID=717606 RepID=E0I9X4_9BACL|nr:pirin-like bicupin family protein [Paenibacillus curdlanolyticus]EFM10551.1 Pirin domain protein [Paenibacillus curdlanolyticus YK9]
MIDIRRAASIYSQDAGWLESRHHFSFGSYYEEENRFFGPLCVFNHDIIAGKRGFGAHPHREMEIVSVVLRGELQHEDSSGHKAVTTFGGIQRMSAGTGIIHSEVNPSEEPVELMQIWFVPADSRLAPSYETSHYDPEAMYGGWLPVVTPAGGAHEAAIHQDVTLYLTKLHAGTASVFEAEAGRLQYLYLMDGTAKLNGEHELQQGDTVRFTSETAVRLEAGEPVFALLIDMTPEAKGGDRA